ncbi:hypothetical protein TWF506_008822 [Arthrobotrys conoides]|uniref:Protein ecm33 n=1 Tax=Arthrobotrys conoides TaxID=74498 RepID=A0AAN8RSH7_9PEZI
MLRNSGRSLASRLRLIAFLGLSLALPKTVAQTDCGDLLDATAESAPGRCTTAADVTLTDNSSVTTVNLRNIQTVGGDLDLRGPALETLSGPSLTNITGDFTIQSSKLSQLEIPRLSGIGADLFFELLKSPLNVVNLSLSTIANDNDIVFVQSPNIQRIFLSVSPSTETGNRSLSIDSLYSLSALEIEGVQFTTVNITATAISSIPNIWPSAANKIQLYSLGLLGNLSVAVTSVQSSLILAGIGSPSANFPNLTTIGGDFNLIQTDTVDLSLPRLRSVAGGFTISLNDKLQSVSVGAVEGISDLAFANNSILADIYFPELNTLDVLSLQYNDYMTSLDLQTWFPKLSQVSQYITLQGQFDNLTFPNLQNGVGIKAPLITVVSSVELDCDAVRNEAIEKQAIVDISNFECTSGPKGSKPQVTGSQTRPTNPSSTDNNGSNGGDKSATGKSSTNIGAIVGGTIGCVVFLVAALVLAWIFVRRRKPSVGGMQNASNAVGGIEENMGGIDDPGREAGGISSK